MFLIRRLKSILKDFKDTIQYYGFKKAFFSYYESLFNRHDNFLLAPIDLMIPVDGKITAGQYIIISRFIDYENLLDGKNPQWEGRFGELAGNNNWLETKKNYFHNLVQSLDKWGWDYNISSISINKKLVYAYNGTHRMAYALKHNPYQVIPFTAFYTGWKWAGENGKDYWLNKGLSQKELDILTLKFNTVIDEIDKSLFIIFPKRIYTGFIEDNNIKLEEVINGRIIKEARFENGYNKTVKSFFHNNINRDIIILRCSLSKQILYIKKHFIISLYLYEYAKKYNTSNIYYTSTITEANQLRIILKSCFIVDK